MYGLTMIFSLSLHIRNSYRQRICLILELATFWSESPNSFWSVIILVMHYFYSHFNVRHIMWSLTTNLIVMWSLTTFFLIDLFFYFNFCALIFLYSNLCPRRCAPFLLIYLLCSAVMQGFSTWGWSGGSENRHYTQYLWQGPSLSWLFI